VCVCIIKPKQLADIVTTRGQVVAIIYVLNNFEKRISSFLSV